MMRAVAALDRDDLSEEEQDRLLNSALEEGLKPEIEKRRPSQAIIRGSKSRLMVATTVKNAAFNGTRSGR